MFLDYDLLKELSYLVLNLHHSGDFANIKNQKNTFHSVEARKIVLIDAITISVNTNKIIEKKYLLKYFISKSFLLALLIAILIFFTIIE